MRIGIAFIIAVPLPFPLHPHLPVAEHGGEMIERPVARRPVIDQAAQHRRAMRPIMIAVEGLRIGLVEHGNLEPLGVVGGKAGLILQHPFPFAEPVLQLARAQQIGLFSACPISAWTRPSAIPALDAS